ncbi:MAG: hypothetical protein R6V57_18685 [Vicinamibacterales bacterium]
MAARDDEARPWPRSIRGLAVLVFVVLATLNSAGYRFGAGDQAFYLPAIQRHLEPDSFPRDRVVIDDQDRLNVFPQVAAALVRTTGLQPPALFLGLHVLALVLLCLAARALAARLGLSRWAQLAVMAALTLKHRVGMTGANTLEGYGHPRMLAFAIGLAAVVCVLRAKPAVALALVGAAFVVHPTTALWFGVWVGVALLAAEPGIRAWLLTAGGGAALVAVWAIGWGPLGAQRVRMDEAWLGVLAGKDYLFATAWGADMWALAMLYVAIPAAAFAWRRRLGVQRPREGAMLLGLGALAALFAATLPFVAARIAIAVQFQVSRIFWMLDLTATVYVVWALADAGRGRADAPRPARRAALVACVLLALSAGRGAWVMWVEHPGRPVVQAGLPQGDWQDAMDWLRRQPLATHVLADPSHAWRHATSVRVAAGRDVYLEEVKDTAMAMYSRRVAMRVAERIASVGDFGALTPASARALADRFELDLLVTERSLDLPLAYRNARFSIYRLRP